MSKSIELGPIARARSVAILLAIALSTTPTASRADPLTDADRGAIRALDAKFVKGWLDDDVDAVLSVFASDAVLLPPGSKPLDGVPAIRSYWWPSDGSVTTITGFDRKIDEIEGDHDFAWLRGTAKLSWTYTKDQETSTQSSRSIDLLVLRRDAAGGWRIVRQIWNTLPD